MIVHIRMTKSFVKELNNLFKHRRLRQEDFEELSSILTVNPKIGDLISASGGVRKVRLRSSFGGKSGGFRVCYFYYQVGESVYLLLIYAKNNQEDVADDQRKFMKELVYGIKKEEKGLAG